MRFKFFLSTQGVVSQFLHYQSWEYPNRQGVGCNIIAPDDSANFLSFLKELRQDDVGSKMVLSAAVGLTPFIGPDGTPMSDVSEFAQVFDHIGEFTFLTGVIKSLIESV